ncbi:LLM class flavin-dependent oxidoreductase [Pseudonocardia pini]|uniref:LLM class flavin-dependent oxidoreductase n=1 Tax=Pseudonocardia pini TaxID=2758030 RepID=UPI001C68DE98|nr:LLM class flavin-dependent oxidoreductase [Pseudonocardia pini]
MTRTPAEPPVRGLSFFLTVPTDPQPGRVYADALGSVRLAEDLGFETAWVAEGHFQVLGLPAALSFLAAATQVADRIRLGTAVLPLAFDNPIRVAETAAFVDALGGGRLELGIGKSNPMSKDIFSAFGLSEGDRETLYADALAGLRRAIEQGVTADGRQVPLYPPSTALADRLWQATGNPRTAAAIGRSGDGLLLFRLTPQGDPGQVQSALIDDYLGALPAGAEPRIGISRGVLPAASRAEAIALVTAELEQNPTRVRVPAGSAPSSPEEYLEALNVKYGSPDDVVEQLSRDEAFVRSTDRLFSLPVSAGTAAFREGLRLVAEEIHPRVRPAVAHAAA